MDPSLNGVPHQAIRKPHGLTVDTGKGKMVHRSIAEFSPMTPGKGIAVRFNTQNRTGAESVKAQHLPVLSPSNASMLSGK
jgi:hypothetical protein